jgi:hypothetical protein
MLSEYEKGLIDAYHQVKASNRWIANELGRSHHVVDNYLNNTASYGKTTSWKHLRNTFKNYFLFPIFLIFLRYKETHWAASKAEHT